MDRYDFYYWCIRLLCYRLSNLLKREIKKSVTKLGGGIDIEIVLGG